MLTVFCVKNVLLIYCGMLYKLVWKNKQRSFFLQFLRIEL